MALVKRGSCCMSTLFPRQPHKLGRQGDSRPRTLARVIASTPQSNQSSLSLFDRDFELVLTPHSATSPFTAANIQSIKQLHHILAHHNVFRSRCRTQELPAQGARSACSSQGRSHRRGGLGQMQWSVLGYGLTLHERSSNPRLHVRRDSRRSHLCCDQGMCLLARRKTRFSAVPELLRHTDLVFCS